MKKIINQLKSNSLFTFILGIMLCSGIVYGANVYQSNSIEYSPTDTSWEVSNVNDALNDLYNMKTELNNLKSLGDATAEDIALGKTAVVNGDLITGTMQEQTFKTQTVSTSITLTGFQTKTQKFTFSNLTTVVGITNIVTKTHYTIPSNISISGNAVNVPLNNKSDDEQTFTVKVTAIGY